MLTMREILVHINQSDYAVDQWSDAAGSIENHSGMEFATCQHVLMLSLFWTKVHTE